MSETLVKILSGEMDAVETRVTEALKVEGFGIITRIDVSKTFEEKLKIDYKPYRILGACNPKFAFQALSKDDAAGLMLPCNVILQEREPGNIEVRAIDPVVMLSSFEADGLQALAGEVKNKLQTAVGNL